MSAAPDAIAARSPVPLFRATLERVAAWAEEPRVRAVVLVGSKSRGHGDTLSDDDLEVILEEDAHATLAPEDCAEFLIVDESGAKRIVYDAQYLPVSALEARRYSPLDLDRWPYEKAPILFDRDGAVTATVAALGAMPASFRATRLRHAALDTWIATKRAAKTEGRNAPVAVRALVARGCRALARVVFALESRWVPLDHWLEAELATLRDPSGAAAPLAQAWLSGASKDLDAAIERLMPALIAEGLPGDLEGRRALFFELIHPSRADERAVHGLF